MYFVSAFVGQAEFSSPVGERVADRVDAGDEVAVGAEDLERAGAHPGHDPHRDDDVGRVGQLDADLGLVGAERAHRERDDVHRAAAMQPSKRPESVSRISAGAFQLLVGPASSSSLAADVGPVLDPGDVAGVGPRQVGVGALRVGEAAEGAGLDELVAEAVVFLGGTVAPVDRLGLGRGLRSPRPSWSGPRSAWAPRARRLRRSSWACSTPIWGCCGRCRPRSARSAVCRA